MIQKIITADKLRFEDSELNVYGTFNVISDDTIEKYVSVGETEIQKPVYGNIYLRTDNAITQKMVEDTIELQGDYTSFEALETVASHNMKKVRLVIGGTNFTKKIYFNCVITKVTYAKSVLSTSNIVTGLIAVIRMED